VPQLGNAPVARDGGDEAWERGRLSKRDRSLGTVAALTAMGKLDQLQFQLAFARATESPRWI